ncbi:hypothetical protein NEOLEDRAFT_1029250, partial [Neolentinus lepideus HHB14362 ss-1]
LFTWHFCQHPAFPECDGKCYSVAEICKNAVYEMYRFCEICGLREVWGYLWTSWYAPKMWELWAQSTTPYISCTRTTMMAENHFKQLKHEFLPHLLRPHLDQLIWILVTEVTPAYLNKSSLREDLYRIGRLKPLSPYQMAFRESWLKLTEK